MRRPYDPEIAKTKQHNALAGVARNKNKTNVKHLNTKDYEKDLHHKQV